MPTGSDVEPTVVPSALPSRRARAMAAIVVLIGGGCGALIGRAFVELQCDGDCSIWLGIGLLSGGAIASVGMAVIAVLTLRAMDEWAATTTKARDELDRPRRF